MARAVPKLSGFLQRALDVQGSFVALSRAKEGMFDICCSESSHILRGSEGGNNVGSIVSQSHKLWGCVSVTRRGFGEGPPLYPGVGKRH